MLNNDILRRIRYALKLNDKAMLEIFALGNNPQSREMLLNYLKKEHDEDFSPLDNRMLSDFLDGLITFKRGKLDGPNPPTTLPLSNNAILKKLRIALEFKEDDMLNTFELAEFSISKGELSAFFRQKGHKHHRECGDQALRNFLKGLTLLLRPPEHP